MADLLPPPIAFLLTDSPQLPREILVPGGDLARPALTPEPLPAPAGATAPVAAIAGVPPPAQPPAATAPAGSEAHLPAAPPAPEQAAAPPQPGAFPSLAALEAILDALTAAPRPMPTAEDRATMLALLGLDPALADDPLAFESALRAAPAPDPDAVLEQWLSEAGAVPPEPDPFPVTPDWLLG